ncbi:MAG: phospholipase, partial [Aliifodinibius sp.]|nr:phospholipase [Fodinibius sp.]NIV10973.1 phospholipase [Fodinibius sp.]NIY24571.1 phospholipase [Fodinibius sp.]
FGTFDIIQRYPNKFAAAVPICGGGDLTRAFMLADMPIWAFHGTKDQIVEPEFSRSIIEAIQLAGGSPGYTEYPDEGHVGAWVQAYRN